MSGTCVHQLIQAQAHRTPEAPAVISGTGVLSFSELDDRADALAGRLIACGVRPEVRVGVAVDQSARWLVTLLAVWKAGGVYVPLDAALPPALATGMLADAEVQFVLRDGPGREFEASDEQASRPGFTVIDLDAFDDADDADVIDDADALDDVDAPGGPVPALWPDNLAYCIFTSGSTGRPKPVGVSHASLAAHATAIRAELGLQMTDRFLQFTSMHVDASLEEVLPALLAGAAVVLPDVPRPTSVELTELIMSRGATMVSLPSNYWHQWTDDLVAGIVSLPENLRTVFIGGDKVRMDKLVAWFEVVGSRPVGFIADYGPTETTISCTTYRPDRANLPEIGLVPIGRALRGMSVRLLDDELVPVADGEPGDVWIAGSGLARGYLGAPSATAARFWPDPFGSPGTRMYHTGDRASRLPDGNLQFLGRSDRQVKIRGFRVEPGQVENAVRACAGIRDAVVVAADDPVSGVRLTAYVEGERTAAADAELRVELAGRLTAVMVPQTIIWLDRIPRSPLTGKALPSELPLPPAVVDADPAGQFSAEDVAERGVAAVVTGIVGAVLGRPAGVDEDFFAAGGDSLRGLQLLSRVALATGAALTFNQLRAAPTVAGLTALIEGSQREEGEPGIVAGDGGDGEWRPASRGQAALWYLDRLHLGAPTYAVPLGYWISGPLEVDRMDAALTALVTRHEALRTTLSERDGQVWSRLRPPEPIRTEVLAVADRGEALRQAEAAAARPFDLSTGPLLRSSCYRVEQDQHLWLLDVHHSALDAWSLGVFWREFTRAYQGRPLPERSIRFADYVAWQERWLGSAEAAGQRRYWAAQLDGEVPALEPGRATGADGLAGFSVPLKLAGVGPSEVDQVARACGATPFGLLLAGFLATLHRMSGGIEDIVVGVPMAARGRPGTEDLIGYLVNTVPLRMRFTPGMRFRELVDRTDAVLSDALSQQDLPFAEMLAGVSQGGDAAENPVFEAMFVLQSTPVDGGGGIDGLEITEQLVHSGTAKVALTCSFRLDAEAIVGEVEFASRRFDPASAQSWQLALTSLLHAALAQPSARLAELPLLPRTSVLDRLTTINLDHSDRAAADTLLHDGFRSALASDPGAIAVRAGRTSLSYAELDARAEAVASALTAIGVGPETLVGVCLARSVDSVVGLLGVLRAGAGFVPLDVSYPAERLRWIAADCAMAAVIAAGALPDGLAGLPLIDPAAPAVHASAPARPRLHPRNTAFVYYTSGSTGRPKGVVLDHGCAASRVEWIVRRYGLGPGQAVVHKTPLIFDVAIWEVFATLAAGATIELAEAGTETDVPYLGTLLGAPGTVLAHFVPSMLDMYLATGAPTRYPGLRSVQTSGEGVSTALLQRFADHFDVELHNAYGQTETSEVALWTGRTRPAGASVPMGRAVNGYRLYVLDEALQPLPEDVVGELYVAGVDGLARGYLGQPELTAQRFLPHPWPVVPGERLYRTGDLASRDAEGLLHYGGRADSQVKVRGVRVEPGEVEAVLESHPTVERAAVMIREDGSGAQEIVAYLLGADAAIGDVAEYASGYLSRYLLPAVYVKLDALPLTPSGKVDRTALPAPSTHDREARTGSSEVGSIIEAQIAEVWCDLLQVGQVGRSENFFAAGGTSLTALQLLHRIKTRFGVAITVRQFFDTPTIAHVADLLEQSLLADLEALSDDDVAERLDDPGGISQ